MYSQENDKHRIMEIIWKTKTLQMHITSATPSVFVISFLTWIFVDTKKIKNDRP